MPQGEMMVVFLGLLFLASCGWAAPDAGTEAVLVEKPWFFGHGGVDSDAIKTGRSLIAMTTEVVYVDMRPRQFTMHFEDFMSKDGVPLDFDAVIRLQVLDSVKLIQRFGENWYRVNVEAEFANRVRQAVRKHGMNEMAIDTAAIDQVDREVTEEMESYLRSAELPLKLVQVTVGKANPPDSVKDQRIATASQQQRQLTEKERKLAEDQRRDAELSRATADNAYRNAMSLSAEQFVRLEQIKMQREVCIAHSCTFIAGADIHPTMAVR
jgi:regulator of protease activity HflC (stomatin/prohibitin superfamily)